jgi:hypothetical protein
MHPQERIPDFNDFMDGFVSSMEQRVPTREQNMSRVHLAKGAGGRSRCRYTARPSRRVRLVSEAEFRKASNPCSECFRTLALPREWPEAKQ